MKPDFKEGFEKELVKYLVVMGLKFFGMTKKDLCKLASDLAEANKVIHRFNKENGRSGNDWHQGFKKRLLSCLSVTRRQPQLTRTNFLIYMKI